MTMSLRRTYYLCIAMTIVIAANAQIKMPPPSPTFELKGTIGLADVQVVYSRPSARGRTIFGDLVPFGDVWRTGANASTKLTFSTDVHLEGNLVPAGEYALYTIPGEEESTIVISKNLSWWGAIGYESKDDLIRFKVPTKHPSSMYESFTISFSDFTNDSAMLNMKWEHTKMAFTIRSQVDDLVMAEIKVQLIDSTPSNAGIYFQAASYYYDNDKDANLALEWANKAIEASGDAKKYWELHLKAKLLVKLGQNEAAKVIALESIELAKAGSNPDYVKLNEKLIAGLK
jgi:Protein of unknown function (DUF2911)